MKIALRPLSGRACSICFCFKRAIFSAVKFPHVRIHVATSDMGRQRRTCKDGVEEKDDNHWKFRTQADDTEKCLAGILSPHPTPFGRFRNSIAGTKHKK
jgi:hypothetical protein